MKAHPLLRLGAACALLSAAFPLPAPAALDFTVRHGRVSADGAFQDRPYITDGDRKIFLWIPKGWKTTDSANAVEFVPEFAGARIRFENVSGVRALPLDEAGKVVLRERVDKSLPSGAKNVLPSPEVESPLSINGWQSAEFSRTYEFYGQAISHSVMFINMEPGRVVQVTVTAPKDSFEKVHDAVHALLFSWSEPSPELLRKLESGEVRGS